MRILFVCIIVLLTSSPSFAGKDSCAHYLRVTARPWLGMYMVPVAGQICALLHEADRDAALRLLNDANRLKAAHNFQQGVKVKESKKILDKFYSKLEHRYPDMRIGIKDMIEVLDKIYMNGVPLGVCEKIEMKSLANYFRQLDSLDAIKNTMEAWNSSMERLRSGGSLTEQESRIRRAKEYRDHLNDAFEASNEIEDFEDLDPSANLLTRRIH